MKKRGLLVVAGVLGGLLVASVPDIASAQGVLIPSSNQLRGSEASSSDAADLLFGRPAVGLRGGLTAGALTAGSLPNGRVISVPGFPLPPFGRPVFPVWPPQPFSRK